MMDLKAVQENWNRFGKTDPFWAVLAWPGMEEGRWEVDAFFATGREEIAEVMALIEQLQLQPAPIKALDFGCGVGRLTQALADYFQEVHGVDISESMLALARELNQHADRCHYHLNPRDDLSLFPDNEFDFVYSTITLQHMPPRYARSYLRELMRVCKPGGVLIFQIPSRPKHPVQRALRPLKPTRLWRWYQKLRYGDQPVMNMYGIPKENVMHLIEQQGCHLVHVEPDQRADQAWESYRYVVEKPLTSPKPR